MLLYFNSQILPNNWAIDWPTENIPNNLAALESLAIYGWLAAVGQFYLPNHLAFQLPNSITQSLSLIPLIMVIVG